ncbi:hypothetical protein B0H14DRAFT_3495503 [Mycena olivaceomarginata]|nr:hypothetical protein B0H14DRAFT_3495503 [Mycena olivaceomarginata]
MALVVPDAILSRILLFSNPPTQVALLLACRKLAAIAKPALYRCIRVHRDKAPALFITLATNSQLGGLVRLLELRGNPELPPLTGSSFEAAFTNLKNLKTLQLESSVDVGGLVQSFHGRLHEFIYWPQVNDAVLQLLFLQPYIQSLYWFARRPVRAIHILYGTHDYEERPVVPLNFIVLSTAQVIHLELQVSQLLSVHDPRDLTTLLPHVREMVVIQDRMWGTKRDPTTNFTDIIVLFVGCINSIVMLEKLTCISTYGLAEALVVREVITGRCTASRLDVLQIFMRRGLVKWSRVRESAEYIYLDTEFADSSV